MSDPFNDEQSFSLSPLPTPRAPYWEPQQSPRTPTGEGPTMGLLANPSTASLSLPYGASKHLSMASSQYSYDGESTHDSHFNPSNVYGQMGSDAGMSTITLGKVRTKHMNSFINLLDPKTFEIETLDKHDDADLLSPWRRKLYKLSPLFTLLSVIAYFSYYGYRIYCTVSAQQEYDKVYVMAWLFIAAEGAVACEYGCSICYLWF